MRLPRVLLALAAIGLFVTPATSASVEDLKSAVDSFNRSKICPVGKPYDIHDYKVFCKEWCDQSRACNAPAGQDPCELGDTAKCHALAEGSGECLRQMNAENSVILQYDRIVERCAKGESSNDTESSTKSLFQQDQDSQQDAASTLGGAVNNDATTLLGEMAARDQKKEQKEEVNKLAASCESRVQRCRQSYGGLPYLSDATRSQCNAYCNNLGFEGCRNSNTIQMAAKACSQAATSDYKSEMDKREAERNAREQEAPPPPPARSSQPAVAEWTCFPSYDSCTSYCRQQTGASGNAGWCGGICSGEGTGNRPQPSQYSGQYCYHAPITPQERANVY